MRYYSYSNQFHRNILDLSHRDTASVIQNINEHTVKTCGFKSIKNAVGRTSLVAATEEIANFEFTHGREVIQSNRMIMKDELYVRKDGIQWSSIAIKFPWYHESKIVGIFGCTIVLDQPYVSSASEALSLLLQTGLLGPALSSLETIPLPGLKFGTVYLTAREKEILRLAASGKTAREIATRFSLSRRTIEHHLENLKRKLGIQSKSELIECAQEYFRTFYRDE